MDLDHTATRCSPGPGDSKQLHSLMVDAYIRRAAKLENRVAQAAQAAYEGNLMSADIDHRSLGVGYFNSTWDLINSPDRTPEQSRDMLTRAFASRQHWIEAESTDGNLAINDWQIAHAASLAGFADVAEAFSTAAYDRARATGAPLWLRASTAEGRARARAVMHDVAGYEKYAAEARQLLDQVTETEDRQLIESQLLSIPAPQSNESR